MDARYLTLVIEEAAEVIQAATKVQRFGSLQRYHKGEHAGQTNAYILAREVGDLLAVIERLDLPTNVIEVGRLSKKRKLKLWGPELNRRIFHKRGNPILKFPLATWYH